MRRQCQRREEHILGAASFGTDTLLVSAMGSALKVASGTTLPMGVRSLAALVTCAIAVVIVVHGYRQERGQESIGSRGAGQRAD